MSTLLIDGDELLYRATLATEFEQDWGDGVWVLSGNLEEATDLFQMSLDRITAALNPDAYLIALSDSSGLNFRHSMHAAYKGGRGRKPVTYKPLLEYVIANHKTVMRPTVEADDVMGILATAPKANTIIVSSDKDMQTIPGKLYRNGELKEISAAEADHFWLMQALSGDATDGYKGCPGYGPVKAAAALKTNPSFETVTQAYIAAGLTRDDAILNARLARILRYENWDKHKQEVVLWTP